jgi:hypothetical protein
MPDFTANILTYFEPIKRDAKRHLTGATLSLLFMGKEVER